MKDQNGSHQDSQTPRDSQWRERLAQLREFINNNHGSLPKQNTSDAEERSSASWLSVQRQKYSGTRKASAPLTSEQRAELEDVPGFLQADRLQVWNTNLEALQLFVAEHQRMPGRETKNTEERRLGLWLMNQRLKHRGKPAGAQPFSEAQREQLERIPGFVTAAPHEAWQEKLDQLRKFIETHDRLPSHKAKDTAERLLGMWAVLQRARHTGTAKRLSPLTKEQRALLLAIPGLITPAAHRSADPEER